MTVAMNGMILKLLQISLFTSAAVLLLAVLSRLLRKKTSPALRMACWLVVALSLLIPARPPLYAVAVPEFVSSIADTAANLQFERRAEPEWRQDEGTGQAFDPSAAAPVQAPDAPPAARAKPPAIPVLPYVWALGFAAVLAVCAVKHMLFLRTVRRWGREVSGGTLSLMEDVKREIGLKRRIRVIASPVMATPVIAGLFRPVIILPEETIEDGKLRFILMHEALHFKRGDIWAKTLSLMALAAHWFNPFVWLMHSALTKESEAACDMAVLRYAGKDGRFQYGETVLYIAKRGRQAEAGMGAALSSAFNSGDKNLKKRLDDIVGRAVPKRWVSVCCAAALFACLILPIGLSGVTASSAGSGGASDAPGDPGGVTGARVETPAPEGAYPGDAGPQGLKDIYADYFLLGTCGDLGTLAPDGPDLELILRHFNAFTFENEMKPQYVQGAEGEFSFERINQITSRLRGHGIAVIGHTLAWHQQTREWMWDDKSKAQARLEAHIEAVIRNSGPHMTSIDVVNEAFSDGGWQDGDGWRGGLRRNAGWYTALGADFIEIAFRKADDVRREIGRPDLKLYYNDHSLHEEGKAAAVYGMVAELRGRGVPIDGIGMQSHYSQNISLEDVRRSLELFNTLPGVEVSVSELDVAVSGQEENASLTADGDALQGKLYAGLFSLYREYAQGPANPDESKRLIARVTVWGVTDAASWRQDRHPLIFDSQYGAKGAYYAVADPEQYLKGVVS